MDIVMANVVLPYMSFLVIDTENKTNSELKTEVFKKVTSIFRKGRRKVGKELKIESNPENKIAYATFCKACKKELVEMIKQFNFQIDQLVPAT